MARAVGLGDDRRDTEGGRERFAENVAEHRIYTMGTQRQLSEARQAASMPLNVGREEIEDNDVGLKSDRFVAGPVEHIGRFADTFKRSRCARKIRTSVADGKFVFDDEKKALGHRREKTSQRVGKGSRVNPVYGIRLAC